MDRVGSTTIQHAACTGSMVTATSVVGVMKMGNTVPRAGLEPTSLAFRASVLHLHHVGFPDVATTNDLNERK